MEKTIKDIVTEDSNQANEEGNASYLQEVLQHGCRAGIVSRLIYYHQTITFYQDHKDEIASILGNLIMETGLSMSELFINWDIEDPLAISTNNQNLLAWFSYEQVAKELLENPQGDVE